MIAAVLHGLLAPWQEPLIRHALVEVILIGIAGGTLGCWIVFYNLAYGAESLAHTLLPGLVVAALTGLPLILGGAAGILIGAIAVAGASQLRGIERDTAVGIVVSTLFGFGVLLALSPSAPAGLQGLLFGDVLGASRSDLILAGVLVATLALALFLGHGRLLAVGFDRSTASALGVRPVAVDLGLLALLAVAIIVAAQGLGTLLVVAVLVAPPATARVLTRRMPAMLATSAIVAVASGIVGLYLSFYAGTAAGASIALVLVAAAALAAVGARLSSALGSPFAAPSGDAGARTPRAPTHTPSRR